MPPEDDEVHLCPPGNTPQFLEYAGNRVYVCMADGRTVVFILAIF